MLQKDTPNRTPTSSRNEKPSMSRGKSPYKTRSETPVSDNEETPVRGRKVAMIRGKSPYKLRNDVSDTEETPVRGRKVKEMPRVKALQNSEEKLPLETPVSENESKCLSGIPEKLPMILHFLPQLLRRISWRISRRRVKEIEACN